MTEMKYKRGALLLADVVNYTTQANKLGTAITNGFNKNFVEKIRELTGTYNGEFIKPIGDAVLIFFEDEERFLDFAIELREMSKNRNLDFDEFFADLRMVAHFGKFSFDFSDQKIADLVGPEGIQVFRIEKYAHAYDVLVTETLCKFLKDQLKEKNIDFTMQGKETLKGFDEETTIYKLIFPEKDEKHTSNLLCAQMAGWEADTKEIPVFGDLYPAMSMEDNFINLEVKTGWEGYEFPWFDEKKGVDELVGIDERWEKHLLKDKREKPPFVDVKQLYQSLNRGIILGLPGSGKTTILKYFSFREFKKNREKTEDQRERLVQQAYFDGRLSVFIDALDEAIDQAVKDDIIAVVKTLFNDSFPTPVEKQGKRCENRVFLTSRYSESDKFFSGRDAGEIRPLLEVRPLDMEQLREMARYFYGENSKLYRAFDTVVWQEEIAAKVGGAPEGGGEGI